MIDDTLEVTESQWSPALSNANLGATIPGAYLLAIVATNAEGGRSPAQVVKFSVVVEPPQHR